MRNHEVTARQPLLRQDGSLREPGWSKQLVQRYDRRMIKAPKFRIKEWDYYLVLNRDFGAAFTISDNGYMGLQSVSLLDFTKGWEHTETIINAFPMGRLNLLPDSGDGITRYHDKRLHLKYTVRDGIRRIQCEFRNFCDGKPFSCDIALKQPAMDTMVIATPWKEWKDHFYYNQKINCLRAAGSVYYDDREYRFDPRTDFGVLDWGRGVWPYNNHWYWGTGSGLVNGKPFGFNIGYGFGDTSAASENILFYDGVCHKLDDVEFHIPEESHMKPWTFSSSDGRFEMEFQPILDRQAKMNVLFIGTDQHQVFGKMSGRAILDDGTVLELRDFLCSAEDIYNRY